MSVLDNAARENRVSIDQHSIREHQEKTNGKTKDLAW
jgi:hypothetical protein